MESGTQLGNSTLKAERVKQQERTAKLKAKKPGPRPTEEYEWISASPSAPSSAKKREPRKAQKQGRVRLPPKPSGHGWRSTAAKKKARVGEWPTEIVDSRTRVPISRIK